MDGGGKTGKKENGYISEWLKYPYCKHFNKKTIYFNKENDFFNKSISGTSLEIKLNKGNKYNNLLFNLKNFYYEDKRKNIWHYPS